MKKSTIALFIAFFMTFSFALTGCSNSAATEPISSAANNSDIIESAPTESDVPDEPAAYAADVIRETEAGANEALSLSNYAASWEHLTDETLGISFYQLTGIPYCLAPTDAAKEILNIFVPEEYMNPDGTINIYGLNNGYHADSAPILLSNNIGGYMESDPQKESAKNMVGAALAEGFVVVTPGTRGRNSTTTEDVLDGRAPEGLVDLKAVVRFLRYNDIILAGDSEKIISDGQSAGGAMSALLATTGDVEYYDPYLEAIGAAMPYSDQIFAAFIFCPITDLENADMAYEWYFGGITEAYGGKGSPKGSVDSALSQVLAGMYVDYLNSLKLTDPSSGETLVLGNTDTYSNYVLSHINAALNEYLRVNFSGEDEIQAYILGVEDEGHWIEYDAKSGEAHITSITDMITYNSKRMKNVPAFDFMDIAPNNATSGENDEFGLNDETFFHFSDSVRQALEQAGYSGLAALFAEDLSSETLLERVYHMNAMNFLGNEQGGDAAHFYIRVGNEDSDSSPLISLNMATRLMNLGESTVNYKMQWEKGHAGDYEKEEMFAWANSICR